MYRTSQLSRMDERPPITYFRRERESEDSSIRLVVGLFVAYAVDSQSMSLSGAAPGSAV